MNELEETVSILRLMSRDPHRASWGIPECNKTTVKIRNKRKAWRRSLNGSFGSLKDGSKEYIQ